MSSFTESIVEEAALGFFKELGFEYQPGPEICQDGLFPERKSYGEVVLVQRLQAALSRLNKSLPSSSIDEAIKIITRSESPSLVLNNRTFHKMVTDGVDVSFQNKDGIQVTD